MGQACRGQLQTLVPGVSGSPRAEQPRRQRCPTRTTFKAHTKVHDLTNLREVAVALAPVVPWLVQRLLWHIPGSGCPAAGTILPGSRAKAPCQILSPRSVRAMAQAAAGGPGRGRGRSGGVPRQRGGAAGRGVARCELCLVPLTLSQPMQQPTLAHAGPGSDFGRPRSPCHRRSCCSPR